MTVPQMRRLAITRCQKMAELRNLRFVTETARAMWNEKLNLWTDFYSRLADQMDLTMGWDKEI